MQAKHDVHIDEKDNFWEELGMGQDEIHTPSHVFPYWKQVYCRHTIKILCLAYFVLGWFSHGAYYTVTTREATREAVRVLCQPAYADEELTQELPLIEVYGQEGMDALRDIALSVGYTDEQWESFDFE